MPDAHPLRPGDPGELGAYDVLGRLGEGGQGSVFLGRSKRDHTELVAIKLLHTGLTGDATARNRFVRELEVAKRVARFCTAQVIDAEVAGDRPYIVSEYVPGMSLQRLVLEDGPRTGGALERLAVNTLTALQAIHQAGIVHRDFKPHNVMMGPDGPRVIDFGVARALGAAGETQNVGTPAYMAPEHFTGGAVGPAADMFAWGTTMAFAATGRPAFGNDEMAGVMHRILTGDPDLGDLPDPLRSIVLACLDKDPARRPSAREAQERLVGAAAGTNPVSTPPAPSWSVPADQTVASGQPGAPSGQPVENSGANGLSPFQSASNFPAAPGLPGADPMNASNPGTPLAQGNSGPNPWGNTGGSPNAGGAAWGDASNPGLPGNTGGSTWADASNPGTPPNAAAWNGQPGPGAPNAMSNTGGGTHPGGPWPNAAGPGVPGGPVGPSSTDGQTNPGPPPVAWNGGGPGSSNNGKQRKLLIPLVAAAAVLVVIGGVSAWALMGSDDKGKGDKPIAQGDGASGNNPSGEAAGKVGGKKSKSPSKKPSSSPSSGTPTKDDSPKPGDGKKPGSSPTKEPANRYTPQQVCNSGGHGGGYNVQRSAPASGGTAYMLYGSSGYNCAVTMKTTGVGAKTPVSVWIQAQGSGQIADSGAFQWYAGPVYVKAPKTCVRFGGNGATAPYGNCG